ncbi:MAG: hypothetical protein HFJ65_02770 [Eggerthellaceae bacterium]|nr:hypothetical protein [Eggerthellaceae bacterium]
MNNENVIDDISDALLRASMPINSDVMHLAAKRCIEYYQTASEKISIPKEEVSERFTEMWILWLGGTNEPIKELRDVVCAAISADENMKQLASDYFKLEKKLEEKLFMARSYAIALIGCAPLIRTLVAEQHLGLDRIRSILNVPGATFDAIRSVLSSMGAPTSLDQNNIESMHANDADDVASFFGDTTADDAATTLRGLLGSFSRNDELWENVTELTYIGFEPYLFMLYYELLTLETTDRFPGRAIYECMPRGADVKALWNKMYHPTQQNPYLNNAKSVYSLDLSWAETKLSPEKQNGSLLLANVFDIMAELPYTTRRRVAHMIRCYLLLVSDKNQKKTPLTPITPDGIKRFIMTIGAANSLTKGVLDQRLVDFLTYCIHDYDKWIARGLGSSVNETNASGRKYGDVEYLDLATHSQIHAYEAHGGMLRDEYVQSHIDSLHETVNYHKSEAAARGEEYVRSIDVFYVAHDISRLERFKNGHQETIHGIPFTFAFMTFSDLVEEANGLETVSKQIERFDELIHERISQLPDTYSLKQRYRQIIGD